MKKAVSIIGIVLITTPLWSQNKDTPKRSLTFSYDLLSLAADKGYAPWLIYRNNKHQFSLAFINVTADGNQFADVAEGLFNDHRRFIRLGYGYFLTRRCYLGSQVEFYRRSITEISSNQEITKSVTAVDPVIIGYVFDFFKEDSFLNKVDFRIWLGPRFWMNGEESVFDSGAVFPKPSTELAIGVNLGYRLDF